MKWFETLLLLFLSINDCHAEGYTLCAFSKKDNVKYHPNPLTIKYNKLASTSDEENANIHGTSGQYVDANNTEHCNKDSDSCYVLWQEDPQNKSIIILTQGCWDSSGDTHCSHSECIAYKKPSKALNNTKFCCCSGNLCNVNVTDGYFKPPSNPLVEETAWEVVEHMSYTMQIIIVLVVITVFGVMVTIAYFLARLYCNSPKRSNESLHLMEAPPPLSPNFDLDTLKIQETVGRGRYGSVCRGVLNDHIVAVKIFCYQNRNYFLNERDIYTLPHMEHPSLPKYIGSEERIGLDGRPEYLLVVSFSPVGCLQDYLRNTTIDWGKLCKMALSITHGLAHLHTEFGKGEKFKPCIAHRDLTSRNILVKPDGTCMLCDFGFAIRISGSKYFLNGGEQVAETTSLADVGTLRYMAPEILEGAVNLRDCESSLKQIDVYALGLVLWEIATRCSDLYQGVEVPNYKLPFEVEVGLHPSMEQMQILVVKHKARPLFPDIWKATNPAVRALKETIEDCWDQDAEARLTALCVEERLTELPILWERYKAGLGTPGISPTINSTKKVIESKNDIISNCSDPNEELISPCERTNSLSECTTETLLSPSEPVNSNNNSSCVDKNNLINNSTPVVKLTVPLQPHQGRNPCLARNLIFESQEDLPARGNLLSKPLKFNKERDIHSLSDGDANMTNLTTSNMQVHASSDILNHSIRVCNPIPYIQNSVGFSSTIPKQSNVSRNGQMKDIIAYKEEKRWGPLSIFDRKRIAKDGLRAGLKNLFERKSLMGSNNLSEEQQPLKSSSICNSSLSPTGNENLGQTNPNACWTPGEGNENGFLSNKDRIKMQSNSVDVVKPLNTCLIKSKDHSAFSINKDKHLNKHLSQAENLKIENERNISLPNIYFNSIEKTKRPNTLPIQQCHQDYVEEHYLIEASDSEIKTELASQNDEVNNKVLMRPKSSGKRKGVKRVKTPFEIKGRFSLYDDRIMSSQDLLPTNAANTIAPDLDNTKYSASVPMGMNTLCLPLQKKSTLIIQEKNEPKIEKMDKEKPFNGLIPSLDYHNHHNVFSLCDI